MKMLDNWLARRPLESMAEMPEMLIVGSLEDAARLRQKYSPFQRLVIFYPGLVSFFRDRGRPLDPLGRGIRGIRVESKRLSANMARLYLRGSSSPELAQRALQNLDEEVRVASARRAHEMDRLCRSEGFDQEPSPASLGAFVKQIIQSQFEFPEVLIREAVQNADGSWDKKLENRIDVELDAVSRTITVSDQGCGMSPEVVEGAFFNLYASLNEHLDYAAGRFGLGAASFFGADHEQVVLDTLTREGAGLYVVVDSDLSREPNEPPRRSKPGTTLSIKLKATSPVDFGRLESILRSDCAYLETPLYLRRDGSPEQINLPLLPDETADTARIEESQIQGHLRRCEEPGVLHILCHRIRLSSIPTVGYSGAINCSALETTVSRDSVTENPVLHHALELVRLRAERLLKPAAMDVAALSVHSRARLYRMFVMTHLLEGGAANELFCRQNYGELAQLQNEEWNPKSLLSGAFHTALHSPLILARGVREPDPIRAIGERLRANFLMASRGWRAMTAPVILLCTFAFLAIACGVISAIALSLRPIPTDPADIFAGSLVVWALWGFLAALALLPVWGLEFVFWRLSESFPRRLARWVFNRALRKEGDWFRRRASTAATLRSSAGLGCVLFGMWGLAHELANAASVKALLSAPRSLEAASVHAIRALSVEFSRVPWSWDGGIVAGILLLVALRKWRSYCRLQFSSTALGADQQAVIHRVQELVGADVPVGFSRGLTAADPKAYFPGQRVCLNPCRSADLNAQQIAFSYEVKARRHYPQASEAARP